MTILNNLKTTKVAFILLFILFLFLFLTQGEPYIRSDGYCYYHPAKTLISTGSFAANTKPEYFEYMGYNAEELDGKFVTVCAPGTSLFLVPGLVVANILDEGKNIDNDYFVAYNGHTLEEGISILVTASIVSFLTIVLIYKTLLNFEIRKRYAFIFSVAGYLSSYALLYTFLLPSFTHTYEAFVISIIIYMFSLKEKLHSKRMLILGLLTGILVLIRPIFVVIIPLIVLVVLLKPTNNLLKLKRIIHYGIGGLIPLIILLVYNYQSYATFLASGYSTLRGENFTSTSNILNILVSPNKGFLVFTPIAIIGVAGLLYRFKKHWEIKLISLGTLVSISLIYSFWQAWEGGGSFGSRFLIFAFPITTLGVALLYKETRGNIRKILVALTILFTIYSSLITVAYRFTRVPGVHYSPIDIFNYQKNVITSSNSISDYLNKQFDNLQGGSGLFALLAGFQNNVLVVSNSETLTMKLYIPETYQRRGVPEELQLYVRNIGTDASYSGKLELTQGLNIEVPFTEINNRFNLQRLDAEAILPISDFEGVKIFNSRFEIYIYKRDNVQIRGDLVEWDPLKENIFVI